MHALWNPDRILLNLVLGLLQLSQSPGSCQQVQKGRGIKRQTHMVLVLGSLPQAAKVGQLALHRNLQVAGPCLEQLCAPQTALLISKPKAHVMLALAFTKKRLPKCSLPGGSEAASHRPAHRTKSTQGPCRREWPKRSPEAKVHPQT